MSMAKPALMREIGAMTDDNAHYYQPSSGHGLIHDPFNAIVGPRPIGWISSACVDGTHNLAPYSFFNAFNYRPPIIGFSTIGWKDTVANIQATGEFVWNLATMALAAQMNATSAEVQPEIDEFALSGLTPTPSRLVTPPRVLESPVNFECRLSQLIQLQGADGALVKSWLVLGEVIAVHIDRSLLKNGVYDTAAAHPILRAGKLGDYAEIRPDAMFEMARPIGTRS
jgi:flavin reductase (DIM6/NTAB) family NADH-FMN oxidoreductase RutF